MRECMKFRLLRYCFICQFLISLISCNPSAPKGKMMETVNKSESKVDKANRLISEKSPYLLQHAYNPVDWYPWGKEVFERAGKENKPVFLSIGYATCHWCH